MKANLRIDWWSSRLALLLLLSPMKMTRNDSNFKSRKDVALRALRAHQPWDESEVISLAGYRRCKATKEDFE